MAGEKRKRAANVADRPNKRAKTLVWVERNATEPYRIQTGSLVGKGVEALIKNEDKHEAYNLARTVEKKDCAGFNDGRKRVEVTLIQKMSLERRKRTKRQRQGKVWAEKGAPEEYKIQTGSLKGKGVEALIRQQLPEYRYRNTGNSRTFMDGENEIIVTYISYSAHLKPAILSIWQSFFLTPEPIFT